MELFSMLVPDEFPVLNENHEYERVCKIIVGDYITYNRHLNRVEMLQTSRLYKVLGIFGSRSGVELMLLDIRNGEILLVCPGVIERTKN